MTIHARKLPFARLALLAAAVAVPLATAGCEDEVATGDRQIQLAIDQSYADANSVDGSSAKAIPTLVEATSVQQASPVYRAQAQALLGQASYTAAIESIPELNTLDVRAGQLLRQIGRLSSRVLENTFGIEAMRGTNPNQPKTAFEQSRQAFAKRLSELEQAIAEAQKKLEAKAEQIEELEAKRLAAANQSTDLTLKSEEVKGQESLNLYNQALEARQQASMLVHQLELARMDLARLQQVIEGLGTQRQAAEEGMKTAQQQAAKLDQGWVETQKLIERQVEETKSIVEKSGIAARVEELRKVSEEAEALRTKVSENLSRAIEAYAAADSAAVSVDANLRERMSERSDAPERKAWESLQKTINPFTYDIARAKALFARAHVAMSERSLLDARRGLVQRVTPIFQQAQLPVPEALAADNLDQRIDELTKQAAEDLATAEETLTDVIDRGSDEQQQNAARFMLMAVQYANYHLADNANALASAQDHLKALLETSILLPALPSDLEEDVVVRAAARPTTGPAAPGTATDGDGQSTWGKILERAGQPFTPDAPAAPGDAMPPMPEDAQPIPGNEPMPEDQQPPGRQPGGNLAPPTGIDL